MKLDEKHKFWFKFVIFLILFGSLMIVIYSPIHELFHLLALKSTGHNGYINLSNIIGII